MHRRGLSDRARLDGRHAGVPAGPPAPGRAAPALPARPGAGHVVAHTDGPLLVLGGPGTGKTTHAGRGGRRPGRRGRRPGADPGAHVRPARRRRAARPDRGPARGGDGRPACVHEPLVRTFHGVRVRPAAPRRGASAASRRRGCSPAPSRTWSSASCSTWSATSDDDRRLAGAAAPGAAHPGLRRASCATCCCGRPSAASGPVELARLGERHGRADWPAAARFCSEYVAGARAARRDHPRLASPTTTPSWCGPRPRCSSTTRSCWPPSAAGCPRLRRRAAPTPTRPRSTCWPLVAGGGAHLVAFADPDSSTFAFRGADPAGVRDVPAPVPHRVRRDRAHRDAAASLPVGAGAARRRPAGWPRRLRGPAAPPPAARRAGRRRRAPVEVRTFRSAHQRVGVPGAPAARGAPAATACRGRGWRCSCARRAAARAAAAGAARRPACRP